METFANLKNSLNKKENRRLDACFFDINQDKIVI